MYKGINAYSYYGFEGILNIEDKDVKIRLIPELGDKYNSLQLKKYITVNCGNGSSKNNTGIAKTWPEEKMDQFAFLFKKKNTEYEVIQLGYKDASKLKNADRFYLGEDFGVVEYILDGAVLHVDIEGGLVHLASQLGTKCVVLFGPTDVSYFGYDKNINITCGCCHNCHGIYADINRCARGMSEPECMYSITPELVMKHVDEYMRSINVK